MNFKDRIDAGNQLAAALEQYRGDDTVIYALPRGGVVIGAIVAEHLSAPLDLLIPRKVGHPEQPEYAIAAVTEDGTVVANQTALGVLDEAWLKAEIAHQQDEARRRRSAYRQDQRPTSAAGKTAVIVDDGIATGLTMRAAIMDISRQQPARVILAIPVAPQEVVESLRDEVDDLVVLHAPAHFAGGISAYYQQFEQVEDDEVVRLLKQLV